MRLQMTTRDIIESDPPDEAWEDRKWILASDSLDALAEKYPCGTIVKVRVGNQRFKDEFWTVEGVCFSLPKTVGGPQEPALVASMRNGRKGNIYPEEVVEIMFPKPKQD